MALSGKDIPLADPVCPACQKALLKPKSRKFKCEHCGEYLYWKYRPTDRIKRLVTEKQRAAIEAEWAEHHAQQYAQSQIRNTLLGMTLDEELLANINTLMEKEPDATERLPELLAVLARATDVSRARGHELKSKRLGVVARFAHEQGYDGRFCRQLQEEAIADSLYHLSQLKEQHPALRVRVVGFDNCPCGSLSNKDYELREVIMSKDLPFPKSKCMRGLCMAFYIASFPDLLR